MRSRPTVLPSIFLIVAAIAIVQSNAPQTTSLLKSATLESRRVHRSAPPAANARIVEAYGRLPLSFEANRGQADGEVKFVSRSAGYNLFLTATEAVMELNQSRDRKGAFSLSSHGTHSVPWARSASVPNSVHPSKQSSSSAKSADSAVLRMKLVGANASAQVEGADELPGKTNYFIGNDPAKWRTNVPTYAKVKYANVYPGIDLVYYGNQRQLEYDFVVSPGSDPNAIRLFFQSRDRKGAVPPRLDTYGDLIVRVAGEGEAIRLRKPVVYQEVKGERRKVEGAYVLEARNEVRFETGAYDTSKPLVVDPVLVYSTYLGGIRGESGNGIAVDSSGNTYVTGLTTSTNFPTANAFQTALGDAPSRESGDAFVTKINAAGSALVYSTFLGGSSVDAGYGIAVDSSGNAYVTGATASTNFPTTANAFQSALGGSSDAFVTKLNTAGSALVYSTYLGGSGLNGGRGIAVDSPGNAYVTGYASTNFPTANAFQAVNLSGGCCNAFITKLNAAGSALVYSTYLGGSGNDQSDAIAVDSSGNAYVTGTTSSTNFPTANAFQSAYAGGGDDVFVTKLNAAGSTLVFSTYLGGKDDDNGNAIAVDSSGSAYVTGWTNSAQFPTANAFQAAHREFADAFVTKFNAAGSVIYSTYLGGGGSDYGYGIAVDPSGNAYVTGGTSSTNFPTANAFQAAYGGGSSDFAGDAFVTKLNAAGSALVYSTYFGGSSSDNGSGIAVDSSGNAYVTGNTSSTNFPTAIGFQAALGGLTDAFVAKIADNIPPPTSPVITSLSPSTAIAGGSSFALLVTGSNFAAGATVQWNGSNRTTTFVSASQLTAAIQASDIASAGIAQISVVNSSLSPTSAPLDFTIIALATNPVPVITSLPNAVPTNAGTGYLLTVNGSNFVSASVVQWNGTSRVTTFVSATQLTAILTAADISAGNGQVTVVNPPPGGGVSNTFTYSPSPPVSNSFPVLASLLPASAVAAVPAFTLIVNGSNFIAGSSVLWNGSNRLTTFVSSTQLGASILAADIAAAGTAQVTVFNPGTGGGISNALAFVISTNVPGNLTPIINFNGTVNGASFAQQPLAAGSIASVFGGGFATSNAFAISLPLPTPLGGVTVRLNGIAAPLFAVTPQQINFQIPWELAGQSQASLTVTAGGTTTSPMTVALANLAPGLFSINASGSGQGAILIANTAAMAAPVGTLSGSRPTLRGETISIYATGLGPVLNPPTTGAATPTSPTSVTTTTPTATIGGVGALVTFAGLAPGFAGLYQVNVQVPQSVTPGNAVPVVLSFLGPGGIGTAVVSNTVTIAVQ